MDPLSAQPRGPRDPDGPPLNRLTESRLAWIVSSPDRPTLFRTIQTEPKYWERAALDKEIERVFDICQGCRLCFNLCPSFPELFGALDRGDGDVRSLSAEQNQRVIDLCYGCKLCEVRCPYTPQDGHEFQLDFPRLMLRARAVQSREDGVALREKMLGNPDQLGKIGSTVPKLANWACRSPFQRVMMEKLLGISRAKKLPEFAQRNLRGVA